MNRCTFLLVVCLGFFACEKHDELLPSNNETRLDPLQSYIIRVAEEGIDMLGNTSTRSSDRLIDPNRIKACVTMKTRTDEVDTLYYVVNFTNNTGFALVAADSTSPSPLLAVTEKGNYTPGEVTNTGFDDYICRLNDYIDDNITPNMIIVEPDSTSQIIVDTLIFNTYSDWISYGPYVNVKWGQGAINEFDSDFPYNQFCFDEEGNICAAGCVPVAIAQIMTFHRFPPSYNVSFMSNVPRSINWDLMNSYTGGPFYSWSQSGIYDVSILIREIGEKAQTKYEDGEGTTMSDKIKPCFTSFGYTATDPLLYLSYNVFSELANRPILMSGLNSDNDGHAWVADGYKSRDCTTSVIYVYSDNHREEVSETTITQRYIHMNWGSDGYNNGYFAEGVYNLRAGTQYDEPYNNTLTGSYHRSVKYYKIQNVN